MGNETVGPDEVGWTPRQPCVVCGQFAEADAALGCASCQARLPASLIKACCDPFDYALRLRTGEIIRFESARVVGAYAHLTGQGSVAGEATFDGLMFPFPRGMDVRLDDIVWCADAPEGS